ncbi:unnamed protein product [Prorocentrum cordatum]|uniref:RNA helicase n=1 Tax=Prorocentrum cordatum TaxID=2364126 RepID=A0ABN9WM29_9DINO|nr:unnamed protein product [Polarella glacialis]
MPCKLAPGLPEVFLDFAGAKHMYRTFGVVNAYAIIPGQVDKGSNDTKRLYKKYMLRTPVGDGPKPCGSFLSYLRTYKLSEDHQNVIERRGRGGDSRAAAGVRFAFETQDNFIDQFCTMMFPHGDSGTFAPPQGDPQLIPFTQHYLKAMKYLQHLARMTGTRPSCEEYIRQRVKEMMPQEEEEAEEHYRLRVLAKMKSTRWVGFARNATSIVELFDAPVEAIADRLHEYSWEPYDNWPWLPPARSDDSEDVPARPGDQLFHPLRCADDAEGAYGKPFHGVDAALDYFEDVVAADLRIRVFWACKADPTIDAQFAYYNEYKKQWNKCDAHARPRITWSADQEEVLKTKVQHENINVETIHSAWHIYRRADTVVDYAPPSRLRTYDHFIIDEASQIEDDVAVRLHNGFRELPQRPTIFFAADFQQLNPLGSSAAMRTWITGVIRSFFAGRTWDSITLEQAVQRGMAIGAYLEEPFHWLTVTNKGAEAVNSACLSACGYDKPENQSPLCGDPKVAGKERQFIAPGVVVRLTRNLDKERGFVNGANGTIDVVLENKSIFTVTLTGTKHRLLVHPITDGGDYFLPCTYGYATTIRRAQGSSLGLGALYFDHCYPQERGYGYVGASRFRLAERIYHFGSIRRTDWLPVSMRQDDPDEQTMRSAQSDSDDEYGPGPRDEETESEANTDHDDPDEEDEDSRYSILETMSAFAGGASELAAYAELGLYEQC